MTTQREFILLSCIVFSFSFGGCFHQAPAEVVNRAQYSLVALPFSAEAQKARTVALAYVDGECKKDTSEFSISVLQDSLNYAVLCRPIKTSFTDSAGKVWISTFGGYDVIIRKVDLTIARVWVIR